MGALESTKKIGGALATLSSIAGGIMIVFNYWGLATDNAALVTHSVVGGLLVLFIFAFFSREIMTSRKEKYANITNQVHSCIHKSRDLNSYVEERLACVDRDQAVNFEDTKSQFNNALISIMDDFVKIFSMLTGTKCRACIKSIYELEGELYVFVSARDSTSAEKCRKSDQKRQRENKDKLFNNLDFRYLYNNKPECRGYYICNDLTLLVGYQSTSLEGGEIDHINVRLYNNLPIFGSKRWWPLSYRSTIVWPVQQRGALSLSIQDKACKAFLAIDSESRNVFIERWDSQIGASIADALFHPLKNYGMLELKLNGGVNDGQ